MTPLRLMIYDATWAGRKPTQTLLTSSWKAGAVLYRALGRLDLSYGATSWTDALAWLNEVERGRPISEVQYWGHGKWGRAMIAGDALDARSLETGHALHEDLTALRSRFSPSTLCWFRTCETFGKQEGHAFAVSWTRFFGCRAAGHTYVIGPWQSGLHSLGPDEAPTWSVDEGLAVDGDGRSTGNYALMSSRTAPRTITCLHGAVPDGW